MDPTTKEEILKKYNLNIKTKFVNEFEKHGFSLDIMSAAIDFLGPNLGEEDAIRIADEILKD
jgi:hypothetical protein